MKWRSSYIQGYLFPSMREDIDPITEALGRLVTTLDVIGPEAFVPDPRRGLGRSHATPPRSKRARSRSTTRATTAPDNAPPPATQGR
jgi:hypothetical protein